MGHLQRSVIKAVLFDLGKVLVDFDFTPAFKRLSRLCRFSPVEISAFFNRSGLEVLYDGGKISTAEFCRRVKKGLDHEASAQEFRGIWNEIFTPIPSVVALARSLRRTQRLVLLSNTNAMHFAYIRERYPFMDWFDRYVLSYREGVRKPDPRIYRSAAKACRAENHQIFYVDDREEFTAAAKSLGFQAFTYRKNPLELAAAMRDLEVLP